MRQARAANEPEEDIAGQDDEGEREASPDENLETPLSSVPAPPVTVPSPASATGGLAASGANGQPKRRRRRGGGRGRKPGGPPAVVDTPSPDVRAPDSDSDDSGNSDKEE